MHRRAQPTEGNAGSRGFTLLELVAVLSILGLLAWIGADGALARVRRLARQTEAAELTLIADACLQTTLRTQSLPASTNWSDWLAAGSTMPASRISRTSSGTIRQLRIDPEARCRVEEWRGGV